MKLVNVIVLPNTDVAYRIVTFTMETAREEEEESRAEEQEELNGQEGVGIGMINLKLQKCTASR